MDYKELYTNNELIDIVNYYINSEHLLDKYDDLKEEIAKSRIDKYFSIQTKSLPTYIHVKRILAPSSDPYKVVGDLIEFNTEEHKYYYFEDSFRYTFDWNMFKQIDKENFDNMLDHCANINQNKIKETLNP